MKRDASGNKKLAPIRNGVLFMVAACAHCAGDYAIFPLGEYLGDGRSEKIIPFPFGILLGQCCLLAAYLSWGPRHILGRGVVYCFLATLTWYCLAEGAVSTGNSFSVSSIPKLLAICAAMLFVLIPIPYWVVRASTGRRIALQSHLDDPVASAPLQFSLRLLFFLTTGAALLGGVVTVIAGTEFWTRAPMPMGDFVEILFAMLIVAAIGVVVAIPFTWSCLTNSNPHRRLIFLVAAYLPMVITLEVVAFFLLRGDFYWLFIAEVNLGIALDAVLLSLLARRLGYRLTRSEAA